MLIKKEILHKLKLKENNTLSLDLCKILNCQQKSLFNRIDRSSENFRSNGVVAYFLIKNFPKEDIYE